MFFLPLLGIVFDVLLVASPVLVPLALLATASAFWDEIREWAVDKAQGWVLRNLGERAAMALVEAIVVLDRVMTAGRRMVRRAVYGRLAGAKGRHRVVTEEVPESDLPESIRSELQGGSLQHAYAI